MPLAAEILLLLGEEEAIVPLGATGRARVAISVVAETTIDFLVLPMVESETTIDFVWARA